MIYYGEIEVEVRLMRQGSGHDGSEFSVHSSRKIRISEYDARSLLKEAPLVGTPEPLRVFLQAIKGCLDEDDMYELQQRWKNATTNLDADQMRKALEVLGG